MSWLWVSVSSAIKKRPSPWLERKALNVRGNEESVNLSAERLAHFATTNICNCVQSKAIKQLVMVQKVLPYAVDD